MLSSILTKTGNCGSGSIGVLEMLLPLKLFPFRLAAQDKPHKPPKSTPEVVQFRRVVVVV